MPPSRSLLERLSTQKALIGLLQSHPNPALTEMAGLCGYDFAFLDCEHGVFSDFDCLHALRALAATDTLAVVRLAGHDLQAVGRWLDLGADVIVVPNVSTAEQAKRLARAMEYPPKGTRGVGAAFHRATRYGLDAAAYLKAPRGGASLLVIIESALGVANAGEILEVEGVDGAIIGPADLSADLGCAGDFASPAFAQAVEHIERAAGATGKILGTALHGSYPVEALVARGHRLLIVGSDISLIREAMTSQVAKLKSSLGASRPP
jgi:2-keto-3-deoxy-L-rhamnonate aldolase RhmA